MCDHSPKSRPDSKISIFSQDRSLFPLNLCRACGRSLSREVEEATEWFCLYKQTGDPQALVRFAKIIEKPLEAHAERRCRRYPWLPTGTHQEIANDVLMKMVRYRDTFDCVNGVWPRLRTYTRTAVFDQLNRPCNQLKFLHISQMQSKASEADQGFDPPDPASGNPEQLIIEDECVRFALDRLPESHRVAYQMRADGATLATIGRKIGCAPSTVHDKIAEAVGMIRAMLE